MLVPNQGHLTGSQLPTKAALILDTVFSSCMLHIAVPFQECGTCKSVDSTVPKLIYAYFIHSLFLSGLFWACMYIEKYIAY